MEEQKKYELNLGGTPDVIVIGASCMCDEHDPDILGGEGADCYKGCSRHCCQNRKTSDWKT